MPEQYQIALDPALGLAADEFIAAWNASQTAAEAGQLVKMSAQPKSYLDPDTVMLILNTLVGITAGVLTNLITDLLKEKYYPKKPPTIKIIQPDGSEMFAVILEE